MRDLFPGYYRLNEEDFSDLWENCMFILDTNVLLNLYRYSEESRSDFLKVLHKIQTRLWVPHQVALEFQENRTKVIEEQEKKFDSIKGILEDNQSRIIGELSKFPSVNHEKIIDKMSRLFSEFLEEIKPLKAKQLKSNDHDYIRDTIDNLFKDKIGEPPTKLELKDIYEEGEERYKINYPPGFKDQQSKKSKDSYLCNGMAFKREYGDLILWKEILKEVKIRNWKHVIFITDDAKEDWWRKEQGKIIGARPELVEEISKAGVSVFYMYTPEHFLKYTKEYIEVDIKQESIQQVEEISGIVNEVRYPMDLIKMVKEEHLRFNYQRFLDAGIRQEEVIDILRGNKPNPNDDVLIECLAVLFDMSFEQMQNIIDRTAWNPPWR